PGPLDRFGRVRQDFHKAALGAEANVLFEHIQTEQEVILKIKEEERKSIVLEQDERSVDIGLLSSGRAGTAEEKCALIVGNETEGVSKLFLEQADVVVEIPMFGKKESFNVSSATAIALYALL
ncbi:MAG: TrmH family RNA methyltransferase, partial [Candidatus Paceibacterota bacterium]